MATTEEIIEKIDSCRASIDSWSKSRMSGFNPDPIVLDLSRADLLERWEAIMMDLNFPNRGFQSRHISRILNLADEGVLILRAK